MTMQPRELTKWARKGGVCVAHGARVKQCSHEGCTKHATGGGVCWIHGGEGKRCSREGCTKFAHILGGICIAHGAKVKRCSREGMHEFCQERWSLLGTWREAETMQPRGMHDCPDRRNLHRTWREGEKMQPRGLHEFSPRKEEFVRRMAKWWRETNTSTAVGECNDGAVRGELCGGHNAKPHAAAASGRNG
jgi:hypothetical protein